MIHFTQQFSPGHTGTGVSLSPFFRYYFAPKEGMKTNHFNFFLDGNIVLGASMAYSDKFLSRGDIGQTGIAPGLVYNITDRVSADAALRFSYHGLQSQANKIIATHYEVGLQVYLKGKKRTKQETEI